MTDEAIMDLYWQRREEAIAATEEKYGGYCRTIARNILADPQDAEECVSDAWLKAWKAMPPHRPPPAGSRRDPPREEGRRAPKARFPRPLLTAQPPTAYYQRSGVWSVKKAM